MKFTIVFLLAFATGSLYANEFTTGRDKNSVEAVQSLEAYAKYKMAQYAEAREIWLSLAARNNTSAFINLANLYEQGQGVERNLSTSIMWLEKAATLGDSRGQFQLGMAYEKGLGVKKDLHAAAKWLEKAAEQNDGRAQFNLGVMLATNYGQGIATSSKEQRKQAISWLEKAKENSTEDAQEFIDLLLTL